MGSVPGVVGPTMIKRGDHTRKEIPRKIARFLVLKKNKASGFFREGPIRGEAQNEADLKAVCYSKKRGKEPPPFIVVC